MLRPLFGCQSCPNWKVSTADSSKSICTEFGNESQSSESSRIASTIGIAASICFANSSTCHCLSFSSIFFASTSLEEFSFHPPKPLFALYPCVVAFAFQLTNHRLRRSIHLREFVGRIGLANPFVQPRGTHLKYGIRMISSFHTSLLPVDERIDANARTVWTVTRLSSTARLISGIILSTWSQFVIVMRSYTKVKSDLPSTHLKRLLQFLDKFSTLGRQ